MSVCPFVTLTKKTTPLLTVKKMIRISGERAYHPLQEKEAAFSNIYIYICIYIFQFSTEFLKNIFLKISLQFIVEDGKLFHLIRKLCFYCQ